jgi:hypothetical protein
MCAATWTLVVCALASPSSERVDVEREGRAFHVVS